ESTNEQARACVTGRTGGTREDEDTDTCIWVPARGRRRGLFAIKSGCARVAEHRGLPGNRSDGGKGRTQPAADDRTHHDLQRGRRNRVPLRSHHGRSWTVRGQRRRRDVLSDGQRL